MSAPAKITVEDLRKGFSESRSYIAALQSARAGKAIEDEGFEIPVLAGALGASSKLIFPEALRVLTVDWFTDCSLQMVSFSEYIKAVMGLDKDDFQVVTRRRYKGLTKEEVSVVIPNTQKLMGIMRTEGTHIITANIDSDTHRRTATFLMQPKHGFLIPWKIHQEYRL